ncbi:MAG: hypothetical protein K2W82_19375 [Candidatus Obscuribacterales bacterium]|nr:hypothetical protein [Candidatus Obscuribacterales bacterium]
MFVMRLLLLLTAVIQFFAGIVAYGQGAEPRRGLKICVANDAPPEIQAAAKSLLAAVSKHSLLRVMSGDAPPTSLTDSRMLFSASPFERAYNHLILVGLADDPLIKTAWQREASLTANSALVFGYGNFQGSLGYIESDRNLFLHSAQINSTPFETEIVTLTGTTPEGVALSVKTFLNQRLVAGLVAGAEWKRSSHSLLKREPLAANFSLPGWIPEHIGEASLIGVIQASDDEYRGVLADTGTTPLEIWRLKYYLPGSWDGAGAAHTFDQYSTGLHRRAYGNTLWLARFAGAGQAAQAAPKIAAAAQLHKQGAVWRGEQPPYAWGTQSAGPLKLWQKGDWVLMSTLPGEPF